MEQHLLSRNIVDSLVYRKTGLYSTLVNHKIEYAAESRLFNNIHTKTIHFKDGEDPNPIISISYRFDGRFVASAHSDHSVRVTNITTGRTIALYGHLRTPWTVKWHPTNPNLLASGCLGSKLILWDVKGERAYKSVFLGDNQCIDSLDFHPTLNILIATCYDSVFLWEYEKTDTPIRIVHKPNEAVLAAVFAGGGELILVGSKHVVNDEFEETGSIEEYLLTVNPTITISKPIVISNNAIFCNDRGLTVSNCGLFLLLAIIIPKISQPHYCILGYGPVVDRDLFHINTNSVGEDISEERSFTRIMQQSLHAKEQAAIIVDSSKKDDNDCVQYGFARAAKCDIGEGPIQSRLAVLSLDPMTKGYILEFINIRDDVTVISVDFNPSNNFILLCTENNYNIYNNGVAEQHATLRVIQSTTWTIVYEMIFVNNTPNAAAWNPDGSSFSCGLCNGDLVTFF